MTKRNPLPATATATTSATCAGTGEDVTEPGAKKPATAAKKAQPHAAKGCDDLMSIAQTVPVSHPGRRK